MKDYNSVCLDIKMSPQSSFQELHSAFPLEQIDDQLFCWFSDHVANHKRSEQEIRQEFQMYYLIRKALLQSQRIANSLSVTVPSGVTNSITTLDAA
jgi:hypothetical protein